MATNSLSHRRVNDRRLYILAAIVIPIVILIGFARTYYLKGFFATPPIPNLLVHVHGVVMTAWVLLFITQVSLVATKRTKVHQQLGIAGAFLAAVVFVVGIITGIDAAARGASPGPPALQFLIIPIGDMIAFGVLVGLALYYRRKLDVHKRLMLLAALNIMTPAIARIPLNFIQTNGPLAFFGLTDLCIIAVVVADTIKHRRLHPVFLWGTIALIVWQPLRLIFAGTSAWMRIAESLVALVK
jgi:hypothetical protein